MNSTVNRPLILGTGESGDIKMSLKTLQRHFGCFGSSGSGKTVMSKVLVEELARNGIPVIAFDPQGDIASLALLADTDTLAKNGTDQAIRDDFAEKVEVVVWTPASSKGMPICINHFSLVTWMTRVAKTELATFLQLQLTSLLS